MKYEFDLISRRWARLAMLVPVVAIVVVFAIQGDLKAWLTPAALPHAMILIAACAITLFLLSRRRSRVVHMTCVVEVTPELITLTRPAGPPVCLRRGEVTSIVEGPHAVTICGRTAFDRIVIPRRCADFERLLDELADWSPIQKRAVRASRLALHWTACLLVVPALGVVWFSDEAMLVVPVGAVLAAFLGWAIYITRRSQFYRGAMQLYMLAVILLGIVVKIVFLLAR